MKISNSYNPFIDTHRIKQKGKELPKTMAVIWGGVPNEKRARISPEKAVDGLCAYISGSSVLSVSTTAPGSAFV